MRRAPESSGYTEAKHRQVLRNSERFARRCQEMLAQHYGRKILLFVPSLARRTIFTGSTSKQAKILVLSSSSASLPLRARLHAAVTRILGSNMRG